jgi:hypothetical protein
MTGNIEVAALVAGLFMVLAALALGTAIEKAAALLADPFYEDDSRVEP